MRTPDDSLYELIRHLTKRERVNFNNWALSGGRNPEYLVLYQEILDQVDAGIKYDEQSIIEAHPEYGSLANFSVKKSDLYDSIVRSIREMGLGKKKSISIELQEIEILLAKKQYKKDLTKIRGAIRKAKRTEKFDEWIILLRHEKTCRRFLDLKSEYPAQVERIQAEMQEVMSLRENLSAYENIYETDFYILSNSLNIRGDFSSLILNRMAQNPFLIGPQKAFSIRAKRLFLLLSRAVLRLELKFDQLHLVNEKLLLLFEENTFLKDCEFDEYLDCFWLQANYLAMVGKPDQGLEFANKMLDLEFPNNTYKDQVLVKYFRVLLPFSNEGMIPKLSVEDLAPFIEVLGADRPGAKFIIDRQIEHYFWLGKHFLSVADFKQARIWFEKITLQKLPQKNLKVQAMSRILVLLCYAELGLFDLFELNRAPTLRFLKRNEVFSEVGRKVIRLLRKSLTEFQLASLLPLCKKLQIKYPDSYPEFRKYFDVEKMQW